MRTRSAKRMGMSIKVYIAGPMRGIPWYNFPAFDEAERRGRELGHAIVSPATLDRELGFDERRDVPTKADLRAMIVRDVVELSKCDAIALLPGWEKSTGVAVELAVARFLSLKVLDAESFEEKAI